MRILIISKYLSSKEVGFEARLFAIARQFALSDQAVTVITSDSNHFAKYPKFKKVYNRFDIASIKQLVIKTYKYKKTISINRVISWIDFEIKLLLFPFKLIDRPDIIIVSSLSLLTILNGIILKYRFRCKLVFEIRDIWPLTMVEEGGYKEKNVFVWILSIIERVGYTKSDLIVGTMPNLKAHVEDVTKKKSLNCICIPFGVDSNFYEAKEETTSPYLIYPIPKDRFIIGYAGSIGLTNGLDAIIKATQKLKYDERFFFIFIGDGDRKANFINYTQGQNNVLFIPKVKRESVQGLLTICDLLYFSALKSKIWDYGWSPNKLIDYMMAGKPVLASYSGYQSMLNEAQSGFFVPAEDSEAIIEKLNHIVSLPNEELIKIGFKGRSWILSNRSWDVIAKNYIYYLSIIK